MTPQQRENCEVLEKFLREFPEDKYYKFQMGEWWNDKAIDAGELSFDICNTAGCAAGWAATIPSLRKQGLKIRGGCPVFNLEYEHEIALRECFGEEINRIWWPSYYDEAFPLEDITPKMVAGKIRDILDKLDLEAREKEN